MHLTGTRSRRRVLRGALFIFAVLTLLACGRAPEPLAAPFDNLPTRVAVAEVPLIVQADFYCGPASLAMVHQWAGLNVTQAEVARQSFTPGAEGTYLADMLGAARRRGQLAVPDEGFENLMREIAAGNPVIVFQNLGLKIAPRWHYGVVVAYDLDVDRIELNSGQHERMVMPVRLFRRTWARGDDWAIVALSPDRLPETAGRWDIARAAAELEKVDPRRRPYLCGRQRSMASDVGLSLRARQRAVRTGRSEWGPARMAGGAFYRPEYSGDPRQPRRT